MIKRSRHIIMGALISVGLMAVAFAATEKSAVEFFFEANQAYKNEKFQKAIAGYTHLIENGYENGHVYFNLGNAYFRRGELGKAILSYERARLLIPRDGDLAFNLAHATNQTQDALGDSEASSLSGFLGLESVNRYEAFFVFTMLNFLFFAVLAARIYKKTEWSYYLSICLAIMISIGACALVLKWYGWTTDDRAVVLSKEVAVRAGPDSKDTVLFKIHAGMIVSAERSEGDWTLLQLSKDKRGWAASADLERIVKKRTHHPK